MKLCMSCHKNDETLLGQIVMHPKLWDLHGDVPWYVESAIERPYVFTLVQLTLVQSPSYSVALFRLSGRFVMSASILAEAHTTWRSRHAGGYTMV